VIGGTTWFKERENGMRKLVVLFKGRENGMRKLVVTVLFKGRVIYIKI
jgi:hypothetical protein